MIYMYFLNALLIFHVQWKYEQIKLSFLTLKYYKGNTMIRNLSFFKVESAPKLEHTSKPVFSGLQLPIPVLQTSLELCLML